MIISIYYIDDRNKALDEINQQNFAIAEAKQQRLLARQDTIECNIKYLNTPKECYFMSRYRCRWDNVADRCNMASGGSLDVLM